MTRPRFFSLFAALVTMSMAAAQPPAPTAGPDRAAAVAREHLRQRRPADAIFVLESELVAANGDREYLGLLQQAYTAHLRELQARKADPAVIEAVARRLRALDGGTSNAAPAALGPAPKGAGEGGSAADILPPAPPIPTAPEPGAPIKTAGGVPAADDPFQQTPRDQAGGEPALARASEAFAAHRYAEAAGLFADADRRKEPFTPAQRDEWTYCRLVAVANRLNKGAEADTLAELGREAEDASRSASDRLRPFATQVLDEIRRRNPAAPAAVPAGWQIVETASFRVLFTGPKELAGEVAQTAEAARKAMYERWVGPPAGPWAPRCDVYLHPTGAEYAKATGKPADRAGHSTVGTAGDRVASRRIDLRADDPGLLEGTLPSEVTQVLLAELFAEQPLPRWAVVGMAALAESPDGVARYLRAVPGLLKEKQLFAVGPFLDRPDFPKPESVNAFYAESVSLVSYLVGLKGPKAFAAFLREAPRRGYAKALTTHYGFRDPADLQDRWVRHVLGGE